MLSEGELGELKRDKKSRIALGALRMLARVSAVNMDDAEVHPAQLLELIEAAEENAQLKAKLSAARAEAEQMRSVVEAAEALSARAGEWGYTVNHHPVTDYETALVVLLQRVAALTSPDGQGGEDES